MQGLKRTAFCSVNIGPPDLRGPKKELNCQLPVTCMHQGMQTGWKGYIAVHSAPQYFVILVMPTAEVYSAEESVLEEKSTVDIEKGALNMRAKTAEK
ncbi:hypothetical protein GCM10009104_13040 [Marinobacterium maritimum]|uniref:Uncharacterized protein n=1 Tax=Marinobacterium maritimum TaxID=500162 RepID=A0ABN1I4S2_9GAMM